MAFPGGPALSEEKGRRGGGRDSVTGAKEEGGSDCNVENKDINICIQNKLKKAKILQPHRLLQPRFS